MSNDTESKQPDLKEKKAVAGAPRKADGKKTDTDVNGFMKLVQSKFNEYRGEFRKIIWLSKQELTKRTVTVVITSAIFGLVIFGMDSFLTLVTQSFFVFVGK